MSGYQSDANERPREEEPDDGLALKTDVLVLLGASGGGQSDAAAGLLKSVGVQVDVATLLRRARAQRATLVDRICERFIERNPKGLVVAVGAQPRSRGQRASRGRWLEVRDIEAGAARQDEGPRRPGCRQLRLSLSEPGWWLRSLGRRGRPVLVVLEESLLNGPREVLDALLDGIAAHLPDGVELVLPVNRLQQRHLAQLGGTLAQQTAARWPRFQVCRPIDRELRAGLEDTLRTSRLLLCEWVHALLYLRLA